MPRGRAPGYETQREESLAHAAELFARQSYMAMSMDQVALACGVSKPLLYHYVRAKYQLLVEIAEDHVRRLKALVRKAESRPLGPEARVRELIGSFLDACADPQAAHRVLTEDVKFLEPGDRERVPDGSARWVRRSQKPSTRPAPTCARPSCTSRCRAALRHMNWMSPWLQPGGKRTHAAIAPVVTDLFFGGLNAVRLPEPVPSQIVVKPPRRRHP